MSKWSMKEKGSISLEACIVVPMFIFLMLFMYSFFSFFIARNEIGHAVLATANSLSLDAYANNNTLDSDTVLAVLADLYGNVAKDNNAFAESNKWYDNAVLKNDDGTSSLSTAFSEALKERFVAYLTDGNTGNVETILEKYNVVGGLAGMDFSDSYIEDDKLFVKVRYTLEYEFQVFDLGTNELQQCACSKLWK